MFLVNYLTDPSKMAQKDYYSILGLSEADKQLHGKEFEDKLSKEFRKLSLKWHPDRWVNGTDEEKKVAEEKFKEIAEAYSVLSDEEKRNQYDNQGQEFDPFPNGFDPFDFVRQHMGSSFTGGFGGPFGGPFGQGDYNQSNPYAPRQGDTLRTNITITLKEAYEGCTKKVKYSKQGTCDHCHGTGFEDGKPHHCPHCNGTGLITRRGMQGGMSFQISDTCPYCHGTGRATNDNPTKCHVCGGSGNKVVTVEHDIPVPRGVDNGTIMGYAGLGNDGIRGGAAGNLEVVFNVTPDPYYQRIGQNLGHYIDVPFTKALMGFDTDVECIDGSTVKLVVPELTKDGQAFVFQGKGMPSLDRFGRNGPEGDMGVIVRYKFPNKLTKKQKELLKKLDAEL